MKCMCPRLDIIFSMFVFMNIHIWVEIASANGGSRGVGGMWGVHKGINVKIHQDLSSDISPRKF